MNRISQLLTIITLSSMMGLMSCQEESQEVIAPRPTETIAKDSGSGSLLNRISQHDGSADNFIDGGSCTSIVFPFTVVVNDTTIEVNSADDYEWIEDVIDENDNDSDSIAIQFPISVTLTDHTSVEINSMEALDELTEDCDEDGLDDDIECVDVIYPISFSTYNEATQQAGTVTINSDSELYAFLDDIDEAGIVSLNYPVELGLPNGDTVSVGSNEELEATIEQYEDSCDEDDDIDDAELRNMLMQNIWKVSAYDSAGVAKADQLSYFEITFMANQVLKATGGQEDISGEWEAEGDDNSLALSLDFDTDYELQLMNKEWEVTSYGTNEINLSKAGDDPITARLITK